MAIRKKQIEVKALFTPVIPALFLLLNRTDIEKIRLIISIIDKIIGSSFIAPLYRNRISLNLFNIRFAIY